MRMMRPVMRKFTGTTVITGASSGIGAALALRFAAPGTRLALTGRNRARLDEVVLACEQRGAAVETGIIDVADADRLSEWLEGLDRSHAVDRIIANAGIALDESDMRTKAQATYRVIDVNLIGALNAVLPLLPMMRARRRGQLVLISSLCAWAPLADTPAYSASKAALLAFGLALREEQRPLGVHVSVVCPGFVRTSMACQYLGWRPRETSAEDAADRIAHGLARDEAIIAFPRGLAGASRLQALLPEALRRWGGRSMRFRIEADRVERN